MLLQYNYVSQANLYGKLFIFTTVVMLVMHIYDFNLYLQRLSYVVSMGMLLFSTYHYVKEHQSKIKKYEYI